MPDWLRPAWHSPTWRGGAARRAFDECKRELLAVQSHKALLSDPHTQMLQAKLRLRTPYITPLNVLQVPPPLSRPTLVPLSPPVQCRRT